MSDIKNALSFSCLDWEKWCFERTFPKFSAKQIYQWIFEKGILDPHQYSNLSLPLRAELSAAFDWNLPDVDTCLTSRDESRKFIIKTSDQLLFEMVLMPYHNRSTLCVSSQVGCKMGCTFCQTGKMGFKRNLSSWEILSQIFLANRTLEECNYEGKVTNVVFMGMGEPLDNYDEVVAACRMMTDPRGLGLSPWKVTISTSGLVPQIRRLAADLPVRLAISLHSANEQKRTRMMPINKRYPLSELKQALLEYPAPKRYGITFEYVMIEGVNDSIEDAKHLVHFLHGIKAKVNLILINHFPGIEMNPSSKERIDQFQSYLSERSIPAPVRYSRGQDVSGGCGQLAAKRENELLLDPRVLHRDRRRQI